MSDGEYGGPTGQYDRDWFAADPYPQPPVISAPPPPPRQKTNTFATLSVVFAFLFAPAGAVLGHLGLAQIRRTGQRGHDRALIGLTLSYAFILIAVAALVIWTVVGREPERSSTVAASPPPATSSATPDARLVTAAQLPKLLLSIDEVKQAVNAPNLAKVEDAAGLSGDQGLNVTPRECVSSLFGGGASAYERTAARAAFTRAITGDGKGRRDLAERDHRDVRKYRRRNSTGVTSGRPVARLRGQVSDVDRRRQPPHPRRGAADSARHGHGAAKYVARQ